MTAVDLFVMLMHDVTGDPAAVPCIPSFMQEWKNSRSTEGASTSPADWVSSHCCWDLITNLSLTSPDENPAGFEVFRHLWHTWVGVVCVSEFTAWKTPQNNSLSLWLWAMLAYLLFQHSCLQNLKSNPHIFSLVCWSCFGFVYLNSIKKAQLFKSSQVSYGRLCTCFFKRVYIWQCLLMKCCAELYLDLKVCPSTNFVLLKGIGKRRAVWNENISIWEPVLHILI